MVARFVGAFTLCACGLFQQPAVKPQVEPFHLDGGGAAFLIKATNTGSKPLVVRPDGICRMRLDGGAREGDGGGGSGSVHTVASGQTWQEIVRLVTWPRDPTGRRPVNPKRDTVWAYREVQVPLTPGAHSVEFTCGEAWSEKASFSWPAPENQTLDARIGPPATEKYERILDGKDWLNPYLSLCGDGVQMTVRSTGRNSVVPIRDLRAALLRLPRDAWPYGRIIALQDCSVVSLPDDREARARRYSEVEAILKSLGLHVSRWPAQQGHT